MRTPSDQSMMRSGALMLALLALGCTDSKAVAPSTPSPLLAMDEDRLWILLWARGDMAPGCGKYYANPTDARYSDQSLPCARWERSAIELLSANGISDMKPEYLREPALWDWYYGRAREIAHCHKQALLAPDAGTGAGRKRQLSCDPYERLTRLERKRPEDVGIRVP